MDVSAVLLLLAVIALVVANGLFVATEFSVVKARRTRIAQLVQAGRRFAPAVQRAVNDPEPYVAATQLGITMASLGLGWIGEPALARLIAPALVGLPAGWTEAAAHAVAGTMAFVIITALHIIFGELAPKSIALWNPEATALATVPPTEIFYRVFKPFIWLLNASANGALHLFGLRAPSGRHVALARDELVMLIGESRRAGVVEHEEESLVRRVFRLTDRTVGEIMVHRTAVVGIARTATVSDAVALIRERGFSRIPVFGETSEQMVGAVRAKDLLLELAAGHAQARVDTVMRPVLYVPETKPVVELLEEMRTGRSQLAVVLEEYGSTAGIVTIEDVLEEIVGEIAGESRPQPKLIYAAQPNCIDVDATIDLPTLNEVFGIQLSSDDAATLGGFIFHHLGRIPEPGERFVLGDLEFTVHSVIGRRIGRVEIRRKT
ncbi:MAG TPA: hemolysin family protein [bacterium]|nr:hemolysin family protein [bacterium]